MADVDIVVWEKQQENIKPKCEVFFFAEICRVGITHSSMEWFMHNNSINIVLYFPSAYYLLTLVLKQT